MEKRNDLDKLEQFIGDVIPKSLKVLLESFGYDSLLSLKQITIEKIDQLEQFIQSKKGIVLRKLDGINDAAAVVYKEQENFVFLPGHRDIMLNFPKNIIDMQWSMHTQSTFEISENHEQQAEYSHILTQMIKTANMNMNKSKQANQYTDDIKYFSTYIFLLCGRACYDTLSRNLPIPSTKTICEYEICLQKLNLF